MFDPDAIFNQTHAAPELNLWRTALMLLVNDAQSYLTSPTKSKHTRNEQRKAFNDLCACGRMTRWLCYHADYDPDWISEGFRKYVQDYYGKD